MIFSSFTSTKSHRSADDTVFEINFVLNISENCFFIFSIKSYDKVNALHGPARF